MNNITALKTEIENLDLTGQQALSNWLAERKQRGRNLVDCFVIMPFSMTRDGRSEQYWTDLFEHLLRPSLEICGYGAVRSTATPENIVKRIMENLAYSPLVLAVLTDSNANVW